MTESEHDAGALSSQGRFARMEAALDRIESKLDSKADLATVLALESRMRVLEDSGSPDAREALSKVNNLSQHLNDIETGRALNPISQQYLQQFNDMRKEISELKQGESNREAVQTAARQTSDDRYRSIMLIVGFATAFNLFITLGFTLLQAFGVFR